MFRLFIKNCNVDKNGRFYQLPFLSTLQFFINNLNILSILIFKWKQLNKERIPDDDQ